MKLKSEIKIVSHSIVDITTEELIALREAIKDGKDKYLIGAERRQVTISKGEDAIIRKYDELLFLLTPHKELSHDNP